MCEFCIGHGDGAKWYLQASTYAFDLSSDLERRGYIVDFVRNFDRNRARLIAGLGLAESLPRPVETAVKRRLRAGFLENHFGQPVPIEDASRILDITTSVTRIPCVCRRFAGTRDDSYCMVITTRPIDDVLAEGFADYVDGPDLSDFDRLDKEAALEFLKTCEARGLMHSIWTFKTPFVAAICNCNLASGCMAVRVTREFKTPIMWRGEYVADVEPIACTGCGECRILCPFDAIEMSDGKAAVEVLDCWGCGICRTACDQAAIRLAPRESVPAVAGRW